MQEANSHFYAKNWGTLQFVYSLAVYLVRKSRKTSDLE